MGVSVSEVCFHIIYFLLPLFSLTSAKSAVEKSHIAAIEKAALSLPEDSFLHDTKLVQDLVNGHAIYKYADGPKVGSVVFRRHEADEGKPVVVLGSGEDYIKKTAEKRTYIVLRQLPAEKKHYTISYAYIRDGSSNNLEEDLVQLENPDETIEWDNWDRRGSNNFGKLFGFVDGDHSLMTATKFNTLEKSLPLAKPFSKTKESISLLKNDLFSDLEQDSKQREFASKSVRYIALAEAILKAVRPSLKLLVDKHAPGFDFGTPWEEEKETKSFGNNAARIISLLSKPREDVSESIGKSVEAFIAGVKDIASTGADFNEDSWPPVEYTEEDLFTLGKETLTSLMTMIPRGDSISPSPNPAILLQKEILDSLLGENRKGPLGALAILKGKSQEELPLEQVLDLDATSFLLDSVLPKFPIVAEKKSPKSSKSASLRKLMEKLKGKLFGGFFKNTNEDNMHKKGESSGISKLRVKREIRVDGSNDDLARDERSPLLKLLLGAGKKPAAAPPPPKAPEEKKEKAKEEKKEDAKEEETGDAAPSEADDKRKKRGEGSETNRKQRGLLAAGGLLGGLLGTLGLAPSAPAPAPAPPTPQSEEADDDKKDDARRKKRSVDDSDYNRLERGLFGSLSLGGGNKKAAKKPPAPSAAAEKKDETPGMSEDDTPGEAEDDAPGKSEDEKRKREVEDTDDSDDKEKRSLNAGGGASVAVGASVNLSEVQAKMEQQKAVLKALLVAQAEKMAAAAKAAAAALQAGASAGLQAGLTVQASASAAATPAPTPEKAAKSQLLQTFLDSEVKVKTEGSAAASGGADAAAGGDLTATLTGALDGITGGDPLLLTALIDASGGGGADDVLDKLLSSTDMVSSLTAGANLDSILSVADPAIVTNLLGSVGGLGSLVPSAKLFAGLGGFGSLFGGGHAKAKGGAGVKAHGFMGKREINTDDLNENTPEYSHRIRVKRSLPEEEEESSEEISTSAKTPTSGEKGDVGKPTKKPKESKKKIVLNFPAQHETPVEMVPETKYEGVLGLHNTLHRSKRNLNTILIQHKTAQKQKHSNHSSRNAETRPTLHSLMHMHTNQDLFGRVGWLTRNELEAGKWIPVLPFLGWGPCKVDFRHSHQKNNVDDGIVFYLTALRMQCDPLKIWQLKRIHGHGLISFDESGVFSVTAQKLREKKKLDKLETTDLTLAFELSAFSQAFLESMLNEDVFSVGPIRSHPIMSKNGQFLMLFTHKYLSMISEKAPAHLLMLQRNLVKFLRSAIVRLVADYHKYTFGRINTERKMTIEDLRNEGKRLQVVNDIFYLEGLSSFIMSGTESEIILNSNLSAKKFRSYVKDNYESVQKAVEAYCGPDDRNQ